MGNAIWFLFINYLVMNRLERCQVDAACEYSAHGVWKGRACLGKTILQVLDRICVNISKYDS